MEDIVAQNKARAIITNKIGTDSKRLCQTIRRWLLGILKVNTVVAAITKQALEARKVIRSGDYENISDTGKHKHRDRIVDHRLVINRHQLL